MLDLPDAPSLKAETSQVNRYQLVVDSMQPGFCVVEVLFEGGVAADFLFLEVNPSFERLTGLGDVVGRTMRSIAPDHEAFWFELYGRVATTGVVERLESYAGAIDRWYSIQAVPIDAPEQRRVAVVFSDVTEMRRGRETLARNQVEIAAMVVERTETEVEAVRTRRQQELLGREIAHRLKNILALVQAIVVQTLRSPAGPDEVKQALLQRIHTLGRAHELLFETAGERAGVHALVQSAIRLHEEAATARFMFAGPEIEVNARSGLMLALTIHELSTNAGKYGALSVPGGRIALTWTLTGAPDEQVLTFEWQESGGPTVQAPSRKGFGSRLIEQALAGTVGGTAEVSFLPEGLVCRITAPLTGFTEQDGSA